MSDRSISDINNAFEPKFEELGAEEIFEHLMLENTEKFEAAREEFEGDTEKLQQRIKEYNTVRDQHRAREGGWEEVIRDFEDSNTGQLEAIKNTANLLREQYFFKTFTDTEEIYVFTNPAYEPRGEQIIREELEENLQKYIRTRDTREIIESVKAKTFMDRVETARHTEYIPLSNGWYNLEQNRLETPDPDKFVTDTLPIEYREEAECPRIKEFLEDVVEEENVPVLQELIGYCLYRKYPVAKAFMLLGEGKNGKSTFLNLLEGFLGEDNIANPSLHDLVENRFSKAQLYGKLANIHADLSSKKLYGTGTFKMLTGQDRIQAERKHKDPFKFRNHAKLIYSANELPVTNDTTDAFFRRWIIIEFPYKFTEDPEDGHKDKDPEILEELTTEEELSGLFNWAIEGLERVLERGRFTRTGKMEEIKEEWLTRTNPLQVFVERHVEVEQGEFVKKDEFYQQYKEFCRDNGAPVDDKNIVGRKMPQLITEVRAGQKRFEEGRERVWKNITLSQDTQDNSNYTQTHAHAHNASSDSPRATRDGEEEVSYAGVVNRVRDMVEGEEPVSRQDILSEYPEEKEQDVEDVIEEAKEQGDLYEPKKGGVAPLR